MGVVCIHPRLAERIETLENSKKLNFLIGCPVTVCIVLPQKSCGNTPEIHFQFPRVSPGDKPLAKEPKDSGYEIGTGGHKPVKV